MQDQSQSEIQSRVTEDFLHYCSDHYLFEVRALSTHVGAGDDGEVVLGRGCDVVGNDDGAHMVQDRVAPVPDRQRIAETDISKNKTGWNSLEILARKFQLIKALKVGTKDNSNAQGRRTWAARTPAAATPLPAPG